MNQATKRFFMLLILHGSVFALIMTAFDFAEGKSFNLFSFLFKFLFFGTSMALTDRYFSKKQVKKKAAEEQP